MTCALACLYILCHLPVNSLIPTARYICWRFKRDIDKLGPVHARDPFDVIFNRKKHKDDSDGKGGGENGGVELVSNHAYGYGEGMAQMDMNDGPPDHRLIRSLTYHGTELRGVPEDDEGGDRAQGRGSDAHRNEAGKEQGSQMHSRALRSGALRAYSRPGGHMTSQLRV